MVGPIQGSVGTQSSQRTEQSQDNQDAPKTGKAIGNKVATFFGVIGKALSSIAGPFTGLLDVIIAHYSGRGVDKPSLDQPKASFTAAEKQQMLENCFAGDFFKSVENGATELFTADLFRKTAGSILESPEAVAAMKAHGITLEEAVAISIYSSRASGPINQQIRDGCETPEVAHLKTHFTSGLAKLPPFEGTVYRGPHLPDDIGADYQAGNVVREKGIMSTTSDADQEFPGVSYSMTLELSDSSAGKDISMFSEKPWEHEVVFPPGTEFQVVSREAPTTPGGSIHVILKEV